MVIGMAGKEGGMLTLDQTLSLGEYCSLVWVGGTPLGWHGKSEIQLQSVFNPASKMNVSLFVTT